jgi:chorismate dehydratase
VPSQCAEALRNGAADIAIIPVIEYQRIDGLAVLPDLAIASKNRVRSLLLIAKKPIDQVQSIALDQSSRSTQALTRILCAEHWKIKPELFEVSPDVREMLERADAAMLIGDPALRISIAAEGENGPGPSGQTVCPADILGITGAEVIYVYDLVSEWKRFTGLPAVLAIWAARREAVTAEVAADFAASRDFGMEHIAEISLEAARELELPAQTLESYLRENIDFTLDEENQRGLELYFEKAARLGLIAGAKPIEWAQRKPEGLHASARQ